jgi:hypothetical protein
MSKKTVAVVTGTTDDFAVRLGVDKLIAYGLLNFLRAKGMAKEIGKRTAAGGRGKPSIIFEIPAEVVVKFPGEVAKAA